MDNKCKYGLRCVTPQGYKDIHVSEVFSEQFVQEMNDVDEKGLSLSDLFTEMVCMASATVGAVDNGCTTVHAKPLTIARDMENYGVDVAVDMREAKSIVTALYGKGTVCTISVRDAILCYAVAETLKLKVGAKVELARDLTGIRLVDDPCVKPKTTLVQLLNYWGKLKRAAQERTKMQCACKDIIPTRDADQLVSWLVSLAGRRDKAFDGALFEFLPKRGVQLHTVELCGWSLNKSPYVPYTVSVRNLKNAVCVGFDRYLHDVKRLCCGRACGCVPYGVRETEDGEWLIANRFLCDGERVRGVTHAVEIMLRNAGLQQLTGKEIDWFQYSKDILLNIEGTFVDRPVVRNVGDAGLCGCTRFEMLIAWFDFIREGTVMLIDVARAVNFQLLDGLYSGTVNCHWATFGDMRITGAYKCICNGKHEVCGRVVDNVSKVENAVKSGCDSFLCGDDPVEHVRCCSAG